jgi:hypothetical protein
MHGYLALRQLLLNLIMYLISMKLFKLLVKVQSITKDGTCFITVNAENLI